MVAAARCVSGATGFASARYAAGETRFSTGTASGTQKEMDNLSRYKSVVLVTFRSANLRKSRQTHVRGANGHVQLSRSYSPT